ncbi:hypothetical protein LJ656_25160 [Paraburkholderia sp. MMS20-SJTR3]|uniref:Uncharacterized protein n=1 Tax=Paraburkholderia sejongensis TaxID=2886946 RepID=A0ABS8K1I8_9BURK|nr:hypothetical protein [Paraburkholderia sp. MMS20-SJTR3]MCC8395880.1 hypothetical protein [Paraburkholderia sp. MMS20-SJTR3]
MSVNLAAIYRRTVFAPFAAARQRFHQRFEDHAGALATEPERLERIAVYARAGYFNMGYTLDSFCLSGEIAPE